MNTPIRPHRNLGTCAKQIDSAIRRNGQLMLDNDSIQTTMALASATATFLADLAPDNESRKDVIGFYMKALMASLEHAGQAKDARLDNAPTGGTA